MGLLKWQELESDCVTFKTFWKADILNLNLDFLDLCEGRHWGGRTYYHREGFSIYPKLSKSDGPIPWTHQLLAPNGIHVYCRSVDEAKEVAEIMYTRIVEAIREQIDIEEPIVEKPRYFENAVTSSGIQKKIQRHILKRVQPDVQQPLLTVEEIDNKEPIADKLKSSLEFSLNQTKKFNEVLHRRYCRNLKHKTEKLLTMLQKRGIEGRVFYSRRKGSYGWMFSQNGSEPLNFGYNYRVALKFIEQGSLDIYK
jgi:hypothetical protein